MSRVKKKTPSYAKTTEDKTLIVIAGPTASGKTDLAVFLAQKFNGEVINTDSRQVYKEMDIGTGKPTFGEMQNIPHHLFDIKKPDQTLTLAEYQKLANKKIKEIWTRGKVPFLVGGTGLYIDAVVYNFEIPKTNVDTTLRYNLEKKETRELLHSLLQLDPQTYKNIDHQNRRRIIRALEVCISTGKPFSEQKKKNIFPNNILYLALDVPRKRLYDKINARVGEWFEGNFVEEVKNLTKKYSPTLPALSAIGYKEVREYLEHKTTLDFAIEKTKQGNRNFVRKQMTWFNKNKDIHWIKTKEEAINIISKFLISNT